MASAAKMVGEWELLWHLLSPNFSHTWNLPWGLLLLTLPWVDFLLAWGRRPWDDLYGYNHGILTTITWDISITPISMAIYHHLTSLELHPEVGVQAQARRKTPIGTWECLPVMCCNGNMYAYTYKQYIYMHTIKYARCM